MDPDGDVPSRLSGARAPPRQAFFQSLRRRLGVVVRLRKLYLLRAELKFAPNEAQRLFFLTLVIGAFCGLAAVAFHVSIKLVDELLVERPLETHGAALVAWTLATPTLGAIGAGLLLQFVVPNARGSGIPQVKVAFATKGRIRARDAIGKFVIGVLQIGTGSSLGREGPTVHICAGIACALGRAAGVSQKSMRRLLPVGAAAGIAAAFNAPIAAVTFTIEEVVGKLDGAVLSGVIVAAALASVIERSVLGANPVFDVPQTYGLNHVSSLFIYALIGIAAAIVSVIFTDGLLGVRRRMRASRLPPWLRPGVGGIVTGALALLAFRWLGTRGVTGGGYDTLAQALSGGLAFKVLVVLCAMKVVATVGSYSTGGSGGIFAPTLFIGGTLGGALGELDHILLHHDGEPLGAFALVGMGAVFAGTIRAPITSVLIIIEMTSGYSLIVPLMIANMTAYVLARQWRPTPIYEALLEQDGIHLSDNVTMDALEELPLRRLARHASFSSFSLGARADEVAKTAGGSAGQEVFPVLDGLGKMIGVITTEEIGILATEPGLMELVNAADLMRPPIGVSLDGDLGMALEMMIKNGVRQLPVTDGDSRCVGFVSEADIARAYLHRQRPMSMPDGDEGASVPRPGLDHGREE